MKNFIRITSSLLILFSGLYFGVGCVKGVLENSQDQDSPGQDAPAQGPQNPGSSASAKDSTEVCLTLTISPWPATSSNSSTTKNDSSIFSPETSAGENTAPETSPVIARTDIFVYDSTGAKELEKQLELQGAPPETLTVKTTKGEKILVAICNFPFKPNLQALNKLESMELLSLDFSEDNPQQPLFSGKRTGSGELVLTPLMCTVTLTDVSNALDNYILLENPRVWLSGMNPDAEILRQEEFRPKQELDAIKKTPLPNDIGFYTQHPGTTLYCYPNDTPENVLGTVRTEFNFECEIEGKTCHYSKSLPPMPRASHISVQLTVFSPTDCLWIIK